MQCTLVSMGLLGFYMLTQDTVFGMPEKELEEIKRKTNQVAFRDPKLIEEHKKKLEAINAKNKSVRQAQEE